MTAFFGLSDLEEVFLKCHHQAAHGGGCSHPRLPRGSTPGAGAAAAAVGGGGAPWAMLQVWAGGGSPRLDAVQWGVGVLIQSVKRFL